MGFVEYFYTKLVTYFQSVQETQFGLVAESFASTGQLMASIVVMMTLIGAAGGHGGMTWGDAIKLIFTVTLVALFMQNWADFNVIVTALVSVFDGLRDSFFAKVLGGGGESSFLGELDRAMEKALESATVAAGRLDIWGAVQNAFVLFGFSALSAFALLGMVFSYALLTIAICFAPVAIMCILSQRTINYFEKWLDFLITALIFPVIIAAILGTTITMMNQAFTMNTENPTAGLFFPVVATVLTCIILLIMSPFIVTSLTGSMSLGALTAVGAAAIGKGASSALGKAFSGAKTMARDTANYVSNQRNFGNRPYDIASRSAKMQRMHSRQQRFGPRA